MATPVPASSAPGWAVTGQLPVDRADRGDSESGPPTGRNTAGSPPGSGAEVRMPASTWTA